MASSSLRYNSFNAAHFLLSNRAAAGGDGGGLVTTGLLSPSSPQLQIAVIV